MLSKICLRQYRNIEEIQLELDQHTTVFIGANGQGKTNILEAISFLALFKSFRTNAIRDLIQLEKTQSKIEGNTSEGMLEVLIQNTSSRAQTTIKKDQKKQTKKQIKTPFNIVIFAPGDLNWITGSPSRRRKQIDLSLSQIDNEYKEHLSTYTRVIKHRNKMLEAIDQGMADKKELLYWDKEAAKNGASISKKRKAYIEALGPHINTWHKQISKDPSKIHLSYKQHAPTEETTYREELAKRLPRDLACHSTSMGPHLDDFDITIDEQKLANFGSRGEQRSVILAMKRAEVDVIKHHTKKHVILLLDDVLSELDESRRHQLFEVVEGIQTVITTTDRTFFHKISHAKIYEVKEGKILTQVA